MVDLALELVVAVLSAVGRAVTWTFGGWGSSVTAEEASFAIEVLDPKPDDRSDDTHGHPDQPDT